MVTRLKGVLFKNSRNSVAHSLLPGTPSDFLFHGRVTPPKARKGGA